ncbi:uncharacterized protein LOC127182708 isoform X2 [Labeo rohita]|uniref:uncharacterized protein LOC127182708 isoform X2 n=1 Tax=Labeo rohita TaxID=84645 RepID=UPI0021E2D110|nr:uncharacterized protein LOC127182708 isoform X2 [Labeo rohita]
MRDHLYLFIFMFHFSTGCIVSDERQRVKITGYTGGSVVLPCSCADSQSTATTVTWEFEQGNRWIQVFEDEKYNDRRVLFNEHSPTNLSLLITDLRMNDQGYYRCLTESNTFTDVDLNVKALTTEDEGDYQCYISSHQVVAIRLRVLHVEEKPHINTTSLTTHQPSHQTQDSSTSQLQPTQLNITPNQHHTSYYVFILLGVFFSVLLLALLAFIWWRCRGGRNEKKATTVAEEQKREQDNQDDVMYSAVAYVKTTSTPAHTHNDPAEFTEYARINVKR